MFIGGFCAEHLGSHLRGQDPQTIEKGCWNRGIGQAAEPLEKALGWEPGDLESVAALPLVAHQPWGRALRTSL